MQVKSPTPPAIDPLRKLQLLARRARLRMKPAEQRSILRAPNGFDPFAEPRIGIVQDTDRHWRADEAIERRPGAPTAVADREKVRDERRDPALLHQDRAVAVSAKDRGRVERHRRGAAHPHDDREIALACYDPPAVCGIPSHAFPVGSRRCGSVGPEPESQAGVG
jgi:hypothetical protein